MDVNVLRATYDLLKMRHAAGGATKAEVDAAKLAWMTAKNGGNDVVFKPKVDPVAAKPTAETVEVTSDVLQMKARLMAEHKRLREAQNSKGNVLALVPKEQNAQGLCEEIISLQRRIELVWDQYRYLEQHGALPGPVVPVAELTDSEKLRKMELKEKLESWRNIKGKAIAKLKNPQKYVTSAASLRSKPAEWERQLIEANDAIKQIQLELGALDR